VQEVEKMAAELVLRKVSMDRRTVGKMAAYSVVGKEALME
jgi:hypothetical protein